MTLAEALEMEDAYSAMCELSVLLAMKAATRAQLSPPEQVISDIMWLDTQVCANGFDGWLYNTSSERIVGTVDGLSIVGCPRIGEIVAGAFAVVRLDPRVVRDSARETLLDSLSDEQRERLSEFDSQYYDAAEGSMTTCRAFVVSRRAEFCVNETVA
jgi:Domain of unknown function (DUF4375)